jgi:hypothetical protein
MTAAGKMNAAMISAKKPPGTNSPTALAGIGRMMQRRASGPEPRNRSRMAFWNSPCIGRYSI